MSVTETLRAAVAAVRSNPAGVAELDAEAAAKVAAAKAEADRVAKLTAKVAAGIAERAVAIAQEWADVEAEALAAAAESLAAEQLEHEVGLTPWEVTARHGPPAANLSADRIEAQRRRLLASRPLPWAGGRTAEERAVIATREAAAQIPAPTSPFNEVELAERENRAGQQSAARAEFEARRRAAIDARKAEARAAGILPPLKS